MKVMWVSNSPTPLNSLLDFGAPSALHEVKVGNQTTKVVANCFPTRDLERYRMAFAINIRSDNENSCALRKLWKRVEIFENMPSMASLNYPPHITLAIYDDIGAEQLRSAAERAFGKQSRINLVFNR